MLLMFQQSPIKRIYKREGKILNNLMVPIIFAPTFLVYINFKPPGLKGLPFRIFSVYHRYTPAKLPHRYQKGWFEKKSLRLQIWCHFWVSTCYISGWVMIFFPLELHPRKLTWHWKIPIFNRKKHLQMVLSVVYLYHFQTNTSQKSPDQWIIHSQLAAEEPQQLQTFDVGTHLEGESHGKKQLPRVNSHSHGQCTLLMVFTRKDGIFHGYVSLLDGSLKLSDFFVGL